MSTQQAPLDGVRVIDASTIIAGPLCCQILGDFGADVIKIEHPTQPDGLRGHGHQKDGQPLWWKEVSRNKRGVALNLGSAGGAEALKALIAEADVLVENFRPGTLERWGLSPDALHAINPGLVIVRITGFGQTGPYASRAGFGTLAESMSGFAHLTGLGADREPDAVLVLEPREEGGHDPILYFRPLAPRDSDEFFADSRYGEFWVGARPTCESMSAELALETRHIDELGDALAKDAGAIRLRVVRDADASVAAARRVSRGLRRRLQDFWANLRERVRHSDR